MTTRTQIEQYVLGALMMDPTQMPVALDILKPSNFCSALGTFKSKHTEHCTILNSMVFNAMRTLYPSRQVHVLAVVRQLQAELEVIDTRALIHCVNSLTDRVGSTSLVEEYAFILVEESIKDSLTQWINSKVVESQKAVQFITAGADNPEVQREQDFAQIRHRMQLMPDVFDQVDALRSFFSNYGYADELEEVEEMASNIKTRTRQIREKLFTNNLLRSVAHLANGTQDKECIDILVQTIQRLADKKATPQLVNHINKLAVLA
jgi:replicative DNA helicase